MTEPCKFESRIIQLCEDVATIKANTERASGILFAVIGISVTVVLQIIYFSRAYGTLETKVEYNSNGILKLEEFIKEAKKVVTK